MSKKVKELICIALMFVLLIFSFLYCEFLDQEEEVVLRTTTSTTTTRETDEVPFSGTINDVSYQFDTQSAADFSHELCYKSSYSDMGLYYFVYMGQRNTGGYSFKVTKLDIDLSHNAEVYLKELKPNPEDMVIQAITYPSATFLFSHNVNDVRFYTEDGLEIPLCSEIK